MDREGASKHLDDGAAEEVLSEHGGVDGGRHEDDAHVRVRLDHVSEDHHEEVRLRGHTEDTWTEAPGCFWLSESANRQTHVDVSLVDLVDDDVTDASDSCFQLPQKNP